MTADTFLLELFKEEQTHARHTEVQRLEVTKFILAVVGGLIAFMGALKFSIYCLPFGIVIMALGYAGIAVTTVYVQRFDDHRTRAREFRAAIDLMTTPPLQAAPVLEANPMVKHGRGRLRGFWLRINQGVILLGMICLICNLFAIWARTKADPAPISIPEKIIHQLSA
jgi:hypothetical protein